MKQSPLTHDEELKELSQYMYLPYNASFSFLTQVASNTPDMFYHYHFIQKKNIKKSVETRLLGMIVSRIHQSQKGLEEIEEMIRKEMKQYSPIVQCLISQKDECVTQTIGQYKYSVCIAGEAKQDSVRLGEWKLDVNYDYIANSTVVYSGGTRCWNGIERQLVAKFECGKKEEIVSLTEPSTCHYEATIKSPCFCSKELVDNIKAKLNYLVC